MILTVLIMLQRSHAFTNWTSWSIQNGCLNCRIMSQIDFINKIFRIFTKPSKYFFYNFFFHCPPLFSLCESKWFDQFYFTKYFPLYSHIFILRKLKLIIIFITTVEYNEIIGLQTSLFFSLDYPDTPRVVLMK